MHCFGRGSTLVAFDGFHFFGDCGELVVAVFAGNFADALPWIAITSRGMSFLLSVVMFWLMYRFLPNVTDRHGRRLVWVAAMVAAIGWEIAKIVFTRFLGNLDGFQAIYGSIAGVVLTMMWIYIPSIIILVGAEAVAAYDETHAALPGFDNSKN